MSIPEPTHDEDQAVSRTYRPEVSVDTVTRLTLDLYGLHVTLCRELDSYNDRNFLVQVDPSRVDNVHLGPVWPHGYVLKIINSLESKNPEVIEAKNTIMAEAVKRGFPAPTVVPNVSGQLSSPQPLTPEGTNGKGAGETDTYLIRLFEYLPGNVLGSVSLTSRLSFQWGQFAARLDLTLRDVDDADLPPLLVAWNMQHVPSLRPLLTFVPHPHQAAVLSDVITAFDRHVLQRQSGLQTGLIHCDLNENNILVMPSPSSSALNICGIIDFGEVTKSPLIIEISIAMAYAILHCPPTGDPYEMAGQVLAGYISEITLSKEELGLLPVTICARFCQIFAFGCRQMDLEPENEYSCVHARQAWPCLQSLWSRPAADVLTTWRRVAEKQGLSFYPASTSPDNIGPGTGLLPSIH